MGLRVVIEDKTSIPTIEFRPGTEVSTGFEVIELESVYQRSHEFQVDPFRPHRIDFHHLIYITDGIGKHFIDFNHHPCREGSYIFVNRHQVHAFDTENRPNGLLMLFTQEFMDSIHTNIRVPVYASGFYAATEVPILTVDHGLKKSCEHLLAEINEITGSELHDPIILKLLFVALLLKLHREKPESSSDQVSELHRTQFANFISTLQEHFISVKDAGIYADRTGMSYKALNQLCKKVARKTPKQIIDEHTILEAKRRLAIENTQVTQLAYELGFDEVGNFTKYFRKHTLVTPSQFQANLEG